MDSETAAPEVQKTNGKAKKKKTSPTNAQHSAKKSAKASKKLHEDDDDDIDTSAIRNRKSRVKTVAPEEELDPSMLTTEQAALIDLIEQGRNIFFTGSAGTGKSFVLKHILARLRQKHPKGVYLTAATGIAAVNIGGQTLHAFAGVHFGLGEVEKLVEQIQGRRKTLKRWQQCQVLIIDEISMIGEDYFNKLERIAQVIRGDNRPFGGIQLVVCGDFFQLPPVKGRFIFESTAWKHRCEFTYVELTTVMRQTDPAFVKILNEIRRGLITDAAMVELRKCCRPFVTTDGIIPTKLYGVNRDVDKENETALESLPSEKVLFDATDAGDVEKLKNCPAAKNMVLKMGAQVVLLRKVDDIEGIVNGSRGVVIGFEKASSKSKKFKKWYETNSVLPIVRFTNGLETTIPPAEFKIFDQNRVNEGGKAKNTYRLQLPLKLAWALTIHRAQGMTLDRVQCYLNHTFAPGQGYVALSRVRSLEGLYIKALEKRAIKVNSDVLGFYKRMKASRVTLADEAQDNNEYNLRTIRQGSTGNIRGFSEDKGMCVTPPGQIIHYPSGSKTIGPHNSTPLQTIQSTHFHSTVIRSTPTQSILNPTSTHTQPTQSSISSRTVTPIQAISGAFLNTNNAATIAIRSVTSSDSHTLSEADGELEMGEETTVESDREATAMENAETDSEAAEADSEAAETESEVTETESEAAYTDSEAAETSSETAETDSVADLDSAAEQSDTITEITHTIQHDTLHTSPYSNGHTYTHQSNNAHYSNSYQSYDNSHHNNYQSNGYHTAKANGHNSNGYQSNGHKSNGHTPNGHKSNGHTRANGHTTTSTHTKYKPIEYTVTNNSHKYQNRYPQGDSDEDDGERGYSTEKYEGSIFDHLSKIKIKM
eukprot:Phypoly_transcript_02418.p1 GENE.Phypoly_transcript_02418~~Phypoly_transcript_02418.p1  ORF type:complete len:933 (+),score=170.69 Phypoly_transcript_02418:169-2799(+)